MKVKSSPFENFNPEPYPPGWWDQLHEKKKKPKYHNKKVTVGKYTFDSKFEAERYIYLRMLEKAGTITNLQLQPKYELQPSYKKGNVTIRAIYYVADFQYQDKNNATIIEDTKGMKTQAYLIKKKIFEYKYPDLKIVEIERGK